MPSPARSNFLISPQASGRGTKMGRTLLVLLWKHFTVRLRRYIHTPIEYLLPLLFLLAMYYTREFYMDLNFEIQENGNSNDSVMFSPPVHINKMMRPDIVLYTPSNNLTNQLMEKVGRSLRLKPMQDISVNGKGIIGMNDMNAIAAVLKDFKRDTHAYVVFENMNGTELPEHLNYTIRLKTNFETQMYRAMDEAIGPHQMFALQYQVFVRLQWTIDSSYLELRNGQPINRECLALINHYHHVVHWTSAMVYVLPYSPRLTRGLVSTVWAAYLSADAATHQILFYAWEKKDSIGYGDRIQVVLVQEFPYFRTRHIMASFVLMFTVSVVLIVSLQLPFYFMMSRLMEERASGVQELIKMMGVTTRMLGLSHLINVLPGALIFSVSGAVLMTISSRPILPESNGFLVWLFLFLLYIAIMSLAMLGSYITNSNEHTTSVALLLYMALMAMSLVLYVRVDFPYALWPLVGLLPFMPIMLFMTEMMSLQTNGLGLTFSTLMTSHSEIMSSTFAVCMMLAAQSALFLALAWYCSLVRPGQYGTALPWNALCRKEFWSRNEVRPDLESEQERQKISTESKYFEPVPANSEVGIEIDNVSKVFSKGHRALNNVSLHVVRGEITVLLGHNGAGKTTLMSIITGMMSATHGKVYVNGLDTVIHQSEVRRQLGYCPQHNLFFPDLNVKEHVMFFNLLKGVTPWKKAKQASLDLLDQLGLGSKTNNMCNQLSGGMKRRLQLAFALAGDANVLVLDEPTAGLDIETRRGLWDLLLSLRAGRTVLLSTHFMEEADALGDRVAALHSGTLRCYATPMHLKKEIDTGYRLSLTLKEQGSRVGAESEISSIVTSTLPRATQLQESGVRTLAFKLPSRDCDKFPELFKKLESDRDKLGIESIGVGVSTLEEVFLKLCSDVSAYTLGDEIDSTTLQDHVGARRVRGVQLYARQVRALLMRQIHYALKNWKMYVVMQILLPILSLAATVYLCNTTPKSGPMRNSPVAMNFDVYKDIEGRRALAKLDAPLDGPCCGVPYTRTDDISDTLVKVAKDDKYLFNKYLIGIELNDTAGVAHYTTSVRHSLPVAVNALTNALAATLPASARVTTRNHPLDGSVLDLRIQLQNPKEPTLVVMYAAVLGFLVMVVLMSASVLPSRERQAGTRHIHIMSGCNPELHWCTTLLFHTLYAILLLIIPIMIFNSTLEREKTISHPDYLGALAVVLFVGSVTFIAFAFVVSFILYDKRASAALIALVIICGYLIPTWKYSCDNTEPTAPCAVIKSLGGLTAYTMPPHTFVQALMQISTNARLNAWCDLNKEHCPNLFITENEFDVNKCCELNVPQRCYLCNEDNSGARYLWTLVCQFIVLMLLVFITQRGVTGWLCDRIANARYNDETQTKDEILEAEQQYVDAALAKPQGDAILVSSVHKRYYSLFRRSLTAVKGITFGVREGECFGLVGVNGAGKSTTFKMMTCEIFPTRGTIVANGQLQKVLNNSTYLSGLGYCPQFFSLDSFMTGRQNMELLLTLEGLAPEDVKTEAVAWLELIDLMKYADKQVSSYSGGCSRRLCSVAALARRAALSLLDEPTAGVDVAARRQLWRAVRAAQAQTTLAGRKRAVLITSHSMDEMEALCARVGLMRGGQLAALGSPAALRAAHHAGLALAIKVRDTARHSRHDVTDSASSELKRLKGECLKFQWTPKDEHKTMLNYHVDRRLKMEYSELFSRLEHLRKMFPGLVEDYAVTETTLEQVFLQYAQAAHV